MRIPPPHAGLLFALLLLRADCGFAELREELSQLPHHILFEAYVDNNWDIMRMRADGTDVVNLTHTPDVHELYPQASPDGRSICLLADIEREGTTQRNVFLLQADGSERRLVAQDARDPCWNRSGTKIAYVPQEFPKFNVTDYVSKGLWIYDLKSGTAEAAPCSDKIEHLYNLCWSPDERWIVSTVHGGMGFGHAILAIDWRDGTVVDLKISGCRPSLSADGQFIAWSENDHRICMARIDWNGTAPRILEKHTVDEREGSHLYHPDISPDARYVTYSVGPGGRVARNGPGTHTQLSEMIGVRGSWDLYVRRADGTEDPLRLTNAASRSNKESEWIVSPVSEP